MDTATMVARVYDGLRDAPQEFIPPEEVLSWLNEAQDDLANRLKVLTKYVEGTTTADGRIPLPNDLIEVRALRLGGNDTELQFPDSEVAFNQTPFASPHGAVLARVVANHIETGQNESDFRLRYVYDPPDLTVEPNTTSELPRELHIRMVQYGRAHGKLREGEDAHAKAYMDMYLDGLPPAPLGLTRINPGPTSFGYEPGPFDTAEAAHR